MNKMKFTGKMFFSEPNANPDDGAGITSAKLKDRGKY